MWMLLATVFLLYGSISYGIWKSSKAAAQGRVRQCQQRSREQPVAPIHPAGQATDLCAIAGQYLLFLSLNASGIS